LPNAASASRFLGDADDFLDREIGRHRPQPLADAVGLVGLEPVQRQLVFFGIDGNRPLAELGRRPHHADRDLATVRHKDLAEFGHLSLPWSRRAL